MDSLEFFSLLAFGVFALYRWGGWYQALFRVTQMAAPARLRWPLGAVPFLCMALLYVVLRLWAADDVRDDPFYFWFYMVIGAGWMAVCESGAQLLGIGGRDDVLERRNSGAGWAVAGALIGGTLCFAGGNVGNGPGVHVVLFSAALASGALFLLWLGLESLVHPSLSEQITVERNAGPAIRLGGLLTGLGLIFGWAVAGDWTSVGATLRDFVASAWPGFLLWGPAVIIERALAKEPWSDKHARVSILLAAGYVGAAGLYILWQVQHP